MVFKDPITLLEISLYRAFTESLVIQLTICGKLRTASIASPQFYCLRGGCFWVYNHNVGWRSARSGRFLAFGWDPNETFLLSIVYLKSMEGQSLMSCILSSRGRIFSSVHCRLSTLGSFHTFQIQN